MRGFDICNTNTPTHQVIEWIVCSEHGTGNTLSAMLSHFGALLLWKTCRCTTRTHSALCFAIVTICGCDHSGTWLEKLPDHIVVAMRVSNICWNLPLEPRNGFDGSLPFDWPFACRATVSTASKVMKRIVKPAAKAAIIALACVIAASILPYRQMCLDCSPMCGREFLAPYWAFAFNWCCIGLASFAIPTLLMLWVTERHWLPSHPVADGTCESSDSEAIRVRSRRHSAYEMQSEMIW